MKVTPVVFTVLGLAGNVAALRPAHRHMLRRDASRILALGTAATVLSPPAIAGPSTDLKTDRLLAMTKYAPRIKAGRAFWVNELPKLISARDYTGIAAAISTRLDPKDKRGKRKVEGEVLAMQRPMELWASSFSRGAQRSLETVEMLEAAEAFKEATSKLELATASEVKDTGFLGIFGAKKAPSSSEREANARAGYDEGTKALNAYFKGINVQLKVMGEEPIPLM